MNLCITLPSFNLHGGVRVIIELANQFANLADVDLYVLENNENRQYWTIDKRVNIVTKFEGTKYDTLLITSPHTIDLADSFEGKVYLHLQMLEHLFSPSRSDWLRLCAKMYKAPYPMFCISKWVIRELKNKYNRRAEIIYMGNGVSARDFPIRYQNKNSKAVLIEGWEAYNPTKDKDLIAHKVANLLKKEGYKIIVYGSVPLKTNVNIPDEYYYRPNLEKLNQLYDEATILVKASLYDCRSCSPVEAMAAGCVTARAIVEGDDDLINGYNAIVVPYTQKALYDAAKKLLTDHELRIKLRDNGYEHILNNTWEHWSSFMWEKMNHGM